MDLKTVASTMRPLLVAFALAAAACGDDDAVGDGKPDPSKTLTLEAVPVLRPVVGEAFTHQLVAATNAGALAWALTSPPEGLAVSESGLLSWTPTGDYLGRHLVHLTVSVKGTDPVLAKDASLEFVVRRGNAAPVVQGLFAGATAIAPGGGTSLAALAHDADGDALTYAWATSNEEWTLTGTGATVLVTAPDAGGGGTTVTVTASDGTAETTQTVALTLAEVPVAANRAPAVAPLVATPNPVEAGAPVVVEAFAVDADGDELTFAWDVSGEGFALASVEGRRVVVSTPSTPDATGVLSLTVSDPGGEAVGVQVELRTRSNTAPRVAPLVLPANPLPRDAEVLVESFVVDLEGHAVSYAWAVTGDFALDGPADGHSVVLLTPPDPEAEGTLTLTVTDALGATASVTTDLRTLWNTPPTISTVAALPPVVAPGGVVRLSAHAVDADGDALTYAWALPPGWFAEATDTADIEVTVDPEAEPMAFVEVEVSDGWSTTTGVVGVATGAGGGDDNGAPVLSGLRLATNPMENPGYTAVFGDAFDPDGDDLTWEWRVEGIDEGGWVVTGDGPVARLDLERHLDGGTASARVVVTVRDPSGASASGSIIATAGRGYRIYGAVENLTSEGLVLGVNGEVVELAPGDDTFRTDARFLGGEPVVAQILSQPDGQFCHVKNAVGVLPDVDVRVVCPLSLRSAATLAEPFTTKLRDYDAIPGLAPLFFDVQRESHVLVTLSVPHVYSTAVADFSDAWFAVMVDGVVVGETSWQSAVWAQGGPVAVVAVANVGAGSHDVAAYLKFGGLGGEDRPDRSVTIGTLGELQLTATVLDSLAAVDGVALASTDAAQQTTAADFGALGGLAATLPLREDQQVLVALQVPQALAPGGETTSFRVGSGDEVVAAQHFRHEGTHHAATLVGLDRAAAAGDRTWAAEWAVTNGGAATTKGPLQLAAVAFDPQASVESSVTTGDAVYQGTTPSFIPGLPPVRVWLRQPGKVFVSFQASALHVDGNGLSGKVFLVADGRTVAVGHVQSQNSNWSTPFTLVTVADLEPGTRTISVQWQSDHPSFPVRLDPGLSRLTAVVLE